MYNQLALHFLAPLVLLEIAVEAERAGLIGAELEGDRLARARALGDAIAVHREAVGDVGALKGDLHEVVLVDLEARGIEALF